MSDENQFSKKDWGDIISLVTWLVIFFTMLVLIVFIPLGFLIIMLTMFPFHMARKFNRPTTDITVLLVFGVMLAGAIYNGFQLDAMQSIFLFCFPLGYLLGRVSSEQN